MAIGIGIGFSQLSATIASFIVAFKTRVLADGGTFEAESCLNSQITSLRNLGLYDKASLIVTPNAYKVSKIYSVKPTSGVGDMSFTRAGAKRVRNAAGVWVQIAANVPPLHYPIGGGCPSWLVEPQATSSVFNSTDFTISPWVSFGATATSTIIQSPIDGVNWSRFIINNAVGNDRIGQNITVAAGQIRTISVFVKADTYSGTIILRGDAGGNTANAEVNLATGVITNSGANVISSRIAQEIDGFRLEITFTTVPNPIIDIAVFNPGVSGVSFLFTQIQVNDGAVAGSPIVTYSGAITRLADVPIVNGISSLFGATNTISVDFFVSTNRRATLFEANQNGNSSDILRVDIEATGALSLTVFRNSTIISAGFPSTGNYLLNQWNRVVLVFNGSAYLIYLNNVLVLTSTNSNFPLNLSRIDYGQVRQVAGYWLNGFTRNLFVYPSVLSLAEINALNSI